VRILVVHVVGDAPVLVKRGQRRRQQRGWRVRRRGEIDWGTNAGNDTAVTVTATFTNPLPLDTTGSFPATLEIALSPLDAGKSAWQTPAGACSIDIAGSMCVEPHGTGPDGGPRQERILSGTGTCSQPAAPESGTSGPAVTIGTFQFLETIGP